MTYFQDWEKLAAPAAAELENGATWTTRHGIKCRASRGGAGRWIYCKYCYKNVLPTVFEEESDIVGYQKLAVCSECGSGLDILERRHPEGWVKPVRYQVKVTHYACGCIREYGPMDCSVGSAKPTISMNCPLSMTLRKEGLPIPEGHGWVKVSHYEFWPIEEDEE